MKKINVALLGFYSDDGTIMLNRRLDAKDEMWGLIGGGIEKGETPEAAILREVLEELEYEIDIENDLLKYVESFQLTTDESEADVHYFKARFPGFDHFADSDEVVVADLELFPISMALNLSLLPMTRFILKEY